MDNVTYTKELSKFPLSNKWPALIVSGRRVTEDQAAEILIRTDSGFPYFYSNDRIFSQQLKDLFGIPEENANESFNERWDREEALCQRLKKLDLSYLHNSQIVSSYIGGPHGWCNWSGSIFTNTYNIGKWPSVEEVAEDWSKIAKAFPYLDLTCQLNDAEQCEDDGKPVVEFRVVDGNVVVREPTAVLAPAVDQMDANIMALIFNPHRERGITIERLKEKLEKLYGEVPQY